MAFWAFDQLKNIRNLVVPQNVKNIGSKIASLVVSREPPAGQEPNQANSHNATHEQLLFVNDKQTFARVPSMQLQYQEYDKLCKLQERIIKRLASEQQEKLQSQKDTLERQLQQLIEQTQKEEAMRKKQQIYEKLESGELELKRLLQQNIVLKQLIHEAGRRPLA